MDRRDFIAWGTAAAGAVMLERGRDAVAAPDPVNVIAPAGQPLVTVPNGSTLAWRMAADGVKIGHLVVSEFDHTFTSGLSARCWGYNGSTPGPLLEAVEGDRVRIYVTNRLPEATTVHWHGMIVPNGMDGVAGLTQKRIMPGETFLYELTLRWPGTYMYHSHFDEMTQMALGTVGMFVVHPKVPRGPHVARDFSLMLHEWRVRVGAHRPDPNEMTDFNVLTFNGKSFPATEPLLVGKGERIRIRLGNLSSMEHHPIHLHGMNFKVTATDGGYVPDSAQRPETTVLVPVGATRVIELVPEEAGDWAMHCHMTHHVMTQMGHVLPMIGVDTHALDARLARVAGTMAMGQNGMGDMGDMKMPIPTNSAPMQSATGPFAPIEMGGMFTLIKVRDHIAGADAKAWHTHPVGSVADKASATAMQRDGIDPTRAT